MDISHVFWMVQELKSASLRWCCHADGSNEVFGAFTTEDTIGTEKRMEKLKENETKVRNELFLSAFSVWHSRGMSR